MAVIRCPVCNAENRTPSQCRRCKADLTLLWDAQTVYDELGASVREAIRAEAWDRALETTEQMTALRGDETRLLRAFLHFAAGNEPGARAAWSDGHETG